MNRRLQDQRYQLSRRYALWSLLLDLEGGIVRGGALLYMTSMVLHGAGIGLLTILYQAIDSMQRAMLQVMTDFASTEEGLLQLRDYREFLSYAVERLQRGSIPFTEPPSFEVRQLYYAYPNASQPVLKDIDLSLRPGERVAIVGANGSGKTTFINVLSGLLLPTVGEILVNGQPIEHARGRLRVSTTVVLQDFFPYDLSVRDNIRLGRSVDAERWQLVLTVLGLYDWIRGLPNGEDTLLSAVQEQGSDISGGQWQRIALARACVDDKASLYIMDEPTASLDAKLEAQLYEEFGLLTRGKSAILVSHRLGITKVVDRVLVFKDGRVIENGTHKELLQLNGEYASMYRAQKALYAEVLA